MQPEILSEPMSSDDLFTIATFRAGIGLSRPHDDDKAQICNTKRGLSVQTVSIHQEICHS